MLTIFLRPHIESRVDTYEKRLATYLTCDKFPENSRSLQRQSASRGLYMEFKSDYLLVCTFCKNYSTIDANLLLASTSEEFWKNAFLKCDCFKKVSPAQNKFVFSVCWPFYTRYVPEYLLNEKMIDFAKKGIIPSRFAVTKCFCCKVILDNVDGLHSEFCIVDRAMKEKSVDAAPLCKQCNMMPVTVRALPCTHMTFCAMCLVSCTKCPINQCFMNVECIEFKN